MDPQPAGRCYESDVGMCFHWHVEKTVSEGLSMGVNCLTWAKQVLTINIYTSVRKEKDFRWAQRETVNALYAFLLVSGCWEKQTCFFFLSPLPQASRILGRSFPFIPETAWSWWGLCSAPATVPLLPAWQWVQAVYDLLDAPAILLRDRHDSSLGAWCRPGKQQSKGACRRCWCLGVMGPVLQLGNHDP